MFNPPVVGHRERRPPSNLANASPTLPQPVAAFPRGWPRDLVFNPVRRQPRSTLPWQAGTTVALMAEPDPPMLDHQDQVRHLLMLLSLTLAVPRWALGVASSSLAHTANGRERLV